MYCPNCGVDVSKDRCYKVNFTRGNYGNFILRFCTRQCFYDYEVKA